MKKYFRLSRSRMSQGKHHSRSGSALVIVLLLAIVLAGLGMALVTTARSSSDMVKRSVNDDRALILAESAMASAVSRWSRDEDPIVGSESKPIVENAGSYWITSSQLDPDTVSLIATADVDRATSVVEVVLRKSSGSTPLFGEFGVFVKKWGEWSNGAKIDSFNSDVGYNNTTKADKAKAHVRTNYGISMKGGTELDGDLTLGGPADLRNGSKITGSVNFESEDYVPPPLPPVPTFPSEGNYVLPYGSRTITGDHAYDSMTFNGGSETTIVGPATITTADFLLNQGSRVIADTTAGPVTFHVSGDFLVNNGTRFITTDSDPKNLRFFISTDNNATGEQVTFQGGSRLDGFIFAPNSDIIIDNGTRIYGAIAAARLEMRGGSRLHQDMSLSTFSIDSSASSNVVPQILMSRTLSPRERDALLVSR